MTNQKKFILFGEIMKPSPSYIYVISLAAILLLSGCARYQARSLNKLAQAPEYNQPEQTVSFKYHFFDSYDCQTYLDRDILAKGYQPIQEYQL